VAVGARSFGEEADVGAETEALDTHLKRSAAAMEEVLQKRLQAQGTSKVLIDLENLAMC
jgi:hypothetical protein